MSSIHTRPSRGETIFLRTPFSGKSTQGNMFEGNSTEVKTTSSPGRQSMPRAIVLRASVVLLTRATRVAGTPSSRPAPSRARSSSAHIGTRPGSPVALSARYLWTALTHSRSKSPSAAVFRYTLPAHAAPSTSNSAALSLSTVILDDPVPAVAGDDYTFPPNPGAFRESVDFLRKQDDRAKC